MDFVKNRIYSSIGDARAHMAAQVAMHANNWDAYEQLHNNVFSEQGLQKYKVINSEGNIIANSADKQELLTNADGTVRHEDFLVIRDMVIEVRRRQLNGIRDLREAGLTFGVGIGEQLVGFENINEFAAATQEMNPNKYDNNDTVFTEQYVPNPITHSTFDVPWRQQGFDYKRSLGMSESLRQVSERLEETLFNGNSAISVDYNGTLFPIYGYTTDPNRGTGTISDWTLEANRDKIVNELIEQISAMWSTQGGVSNDSVVVYVANDIWNITQKDYITGQVSKTIKERMEDVAQVKEVKPAEKLANGQVVLVEMERRSVELAIASDIIVTPHTKTNPMAPQTMTTYAAMVHKIKSDSNGATGVRHLTV